MQFTTFRTTTYSTKTINKLLTLLAAGNTISKACASPGMPASGTVFTWISKFPEFQAAYKQVKRLAVLPMMEDILNIADDASEDQIITVSPSGIIKTKPNREKIRHDKLKIHVRKWLISRLIPKRYSVFEYVFTYQSFRGQRIVEQGIKL